MTSIPRVDDGVHTIDLNSDLGEGFGPWLMGDDESLLSLVSSANVACGYHAGDATTMRRTCTGAVARSVRIGAHVAYRDLAGFGRRDIDVPAAALTNDVLYQIGALAACARAAGGEVSYLKPHGALYNRIVWDPEQAGAVVEAVRLYDPTMPVLGLPGSEFLMLAEQAGLPTAGEGFVDRGYDGAGRLVPRGVAGALVHDPKVAAERAVQMAVAGTVLSIDGQLVAVHPRSLCVHGDTPGATEIARHVRHALHDADVRLSSFA